MCEEYVQYILIHPNFGGGAVGYRFVQIWKMEKNSFSTN